VVLAAVDPGADPVVLALDQQLVPHQVLLMVFLLIMDGEMLVERIQLVGTPKVVEAVVVLELLVLRKQALVLVEQVETDKCSQSLVYQ
jgi:hypothetical protein